MIKYSFYRKSENMRIESDLSSIKTIDECLSYLRSTLINYKTLYSKVYSDYEGKAFSKQIKAYENNGKYIVTVSLFNGLKVSELDVCLTDKKPKMPHPVFPILSSFAPNAIVYSFKQNT